jgi:AraC-like DNA-binding protein
VHFYENFWVILTIFKEIYIELCFESGFNNLACFNENFKAIIGKSPKEYQHESHRDDRWSDCATNYCEEKMSESRLISQSQSPHHP